MAAIAFLMKHNHKRRTETGREEGVDSPASNEEGGAEVLFYKTKRLLGGGGGSLYVCDKNFRSRLEGVDKISVSMCRRVSKFRKKSWGDV